MKVKTAYLMVFVVLIGGLFASCATQELTVADVWARPGFKDGNTAIYFNIENSTGQVDTLLSAQADIAQAVELHRSMMVSPEEAAEMGGEAGMGNGSMASGNDQMGDDMVMVMQQQENVPVPSGETLAFEPGGYHVMVIGLHDDLEVGDHFQLILTFQNAGEIRLDVPVGMP